MQLFNLMGNNGKEQGTAKYAGFWHTFDQVLVSRSLFEESNGLGVQDNIAVIIDFPFLLEDDRSHLGVKPFRTFLGPSYHRGYSDHLPINIRINKTAIEPQGIIQNSHWGKPNE